MVESDQKPVKPSSNNTSFMCFMWPFHTPGSHHKFDSHGRPLLLNIMVVLEEKEDFKPVHTSFSS